MILARNATEALGFALMLSGFYEELGPEALIVGVDTPGSHLPFKRLQDFGNPQGRDLWVDYQPWGSYDYEGKSRRWRQLPCTKANFVIRGRISKENILEAISSMLPTKPSNVLVCIPHVIPQTGEIIPLAEISQAIRRIQPKAIIVIEGSYALLTKEAIVLSDRTFYVAGVNKTFCAPPCGFCITTDQLGEDKIDRLSLEYPLLKGMFPECSAESRRMLGNLSTAELAFFVNMIDQCVSREELVHLCQEQKSLLYQTLRAHHYVEEGWPMGATTANILSLRLHGTDQYRLAETLRTDKKYPCAYFGKYDCMRFCVGPNTALTKSNAQDFSQTVARISRRLRASN